MLVGEYTDRAGWTWEVRRWRSLVSPSTFWTDDEEWSAELLDGPFAEAGETCGPCDTGKELELAIEDRTALLVEILAEREAGL